MKTKTIILGVIVAIIAFLSSSCSTEQVTPVQTGTDYSFLVQAQGNTDLVYKGELTWNVTGQTAITQKVTSHSFSSRFTLVKTSDVFTFIGTTDMNLTVTITRYSDNVSKTFNIESGQVLTFKK